MMGEPVPLSDHYRWLAGRVREGRRETPQRFRPLASRLAREPSDTGRIWSLYGWILRYLLAEFGENPSRPAHLAALVERARVLVEERFIESDIIALETEVKTLTPSRRRRRSVHCHGKIASDRVLLMLRTMLPTLRTIGRRVSWSGAEQHNLALSIEHTVAYYVADYDYDHFVMLGPDVATRFTLIALWCQFNMPGDGLDSMKGRLAG